MTFQKKGLKQHSLFPRLHFPLLATLLCCLYVSSCGIPEDRTYYGDEEIRRIIDQINFRIDSLTLTEHPNPVAFFDSLVRVNPNPGIEDLFHKYLAIGLYFDEKEKNYNTALSYADSTLQLFEGNQYKPEYEMFHVYAILRKGEILRGLHLYGTAIQHFLRGWRMIDTDKTPCMASEYLGRMGTTSYRQENYRDAIDFYSRSWQVSSLCPAHTDFTWFVRTYHHYHNLASNYYGLQMPDSTLFYNELAIALIDEKEESGVFSEAPNQVHFLEVARGVAYANKGTSLATLDRGEEAVWFWKESVGINERRGFANEHAELTRLLLAGYYIEEGLLDEAGVQLAMARDWLDRFSSESAERRWWEMQWKFLDRTGDETEAYAAYKQYMEMEETATDNRIEAGAVDMASQIRLFEQQHEIDRLVREREINQIYLVSAIIISMMAFVIIFLVWRNWRLSRKNIDRLTDLNTTISKQNNQLEKSNKAITKIMSVVAHDLRSPLAGVRELSSMMLDDEMINGDQRKWAQMIHQSSNQSMKLVGEIINFDFLQQDSVNVEKKPVEMYAFLQQCTDMLQFQANAKNQVITFCKPAGEDEGIVCLIDRHEMTRVINNVAGNAMKFSPEGSSIILKLEQTKDHIRISVKDQGIGIPDEMKELVFDMFTESRRHGTNGEESFGLGLAISKLIVEGHNGKIWFESDEKSGTTFYIELLSGEKQ